MKTKSYLIKTSRLDDKVELVTLLIVESDINSVTIKKNTVIISAKSSLFSKLERRFSFLKPINVKKIFRVKFHYFDGSKAKDRYVVFPRPEYKAAKSEFEFIYALQEDCMKLINNANVGDSFEAPRIERDCNPGTMTLTRIK